MKKTIFAAALAVSAVALAAPAMADVGAGLVGNTVTLTAADGAVTKIFYPDTSSIVVKAADGSEISGSWRVADNTICTTMGEAPENCTAPIEDAPTVGGSGTIEGEQGNVNWSVTAGKDF
ncbi:MAG: hypothetical protein Q8J92_03320 [Parvibaculum sp.]|nr:hypothetical protein [Parvibaculum sp.]MDZ4368289.1 hypothetical protein [Afipia sp.]